MRKAHYESLRYEMNVMYSCGAGSIVVVASGFLAGKFGSSSIAINHRDRGSVGRVVTSHDFLLYSFFFLRRNEKPPRKTPCPEPSTLRTRGARTETAGVCCRTPRVPASEQTGNGGQLKEKGPARRYASPRPEPLTFPARGRVLLREEFFNVILLTSLPRHSLEITASKFSDFVATCGVSERLRGARRIASNLSSDRNLRQRGRGGIVFAESAEMWNRRRKNSPEGRIGVRTKV